MKVQPQLRFLVVFLTATSPIYGWYWALNNLAPSWALFFLWLPLLSIHGLVPIGDLLLKGDNHPPIEGQTPFFNKLLPLLCLPAWYAAVLSGAYLAAGPGINGWAIAAISLSLGAIGAILAINPAHELIHRNSPLERNAGGLLLAGVCYGAFKVEHVRGHHLNAATPRDTASAVKGESVFSFAPKSMIGTVVHAHSLESSRLKKLGLTPFSVKWLFKNEVLRWNFVSLLLALAIGLAWGPWSLAVFLLASLGAILELEVINYIEHYGLRRKQISDSARPGVQRFEPVQEHHSWNANSIMSNVFLFNLQRHSDHHAHAGKDYLHLASVSSAPQLPAGYSIMFLVALCPPLWRKMMDHRVPA
jgi:alkane 1-monooxygenase